MTTAELIASLASADKVVVKCVTTPKFLKKSRLSKEPCKYTDVKKVGSYALALQDKYIPTEKPEGATATERKPWYKPTEFSWLKVSLDGTKHYISAHCLAVESEFIADGKVLNEDEVRALRAEFLPVHKPTAKDEQMWVMLSADNVLEIVK